LRTPIAAVALALPVFASGCDDKSQATGTSPPRATEVAPAARGAVGAYAKSGRTPWTEARASSMDATSPAVPPLGVPKHPDGGGVTL
jgi:hypothetical protein